jgi:hypothetical protein
MREEDWASGVQSDSWDPRFFHRSAAFAPLASAASKLQDHADWPGPRQLRDLLLDSAVASGGGQPLRLVDPQPRSGALHPGYEARCFLTGELETREKNWHDLFNTLVWVTFPRTKAAINARHYRAQQMSAVRSMRGAERDALTLFDECGVVVASTDASLLALLQGFAWKELFWHRRQDMLAHMRVYIFGHGLYEQALRPFIGMTGKAILLHVEQSCLDQPLDLQLVSLDVQLARIIATPEKFKHPRELSPLPVLGVPGWTADNAKESFYDNTEYFRPGRKRDLGINLHGCESIPVAFHPQNCIRRDPS